MFDGERDTNRSSLISAYKKAVHTLRKYDFLAETKEYEELEVELFHMHATISNLNTKLANDRFQRYTKLSPVEKKIDVYTSLGISKNIPRTKISAHL